jgi:hypothetical protein
LHLLVVAPRLTRPYQQELQMLAITSQEQEAGIWRLQGGMALHPTWVLETEVLAGLSHPLLTLVSPTFLAHPLSAYEQLRQGGYTQLVVYLTQQIQQFQLRREEFAMQHLGTEDELKHVLRQILASMSPEERLETLSEEERRKILATLPPEERLEGLSEEERLKGLTPEQLEHLRQLLQQPRPGEDGTSSPKSS